jgi:hypothetical protein
MSMAISVSVTLAVDWSVVGDSLVQNLSLESSLGADDVVNSSEDTVGLQNRVRSLGQTTISVFVSGLEVSGMFVIDTIVVLVFWVSVVIVSSVAMSIPSMSEFGVGNSDCDQNGQTDDDG